MSQTTCAVCIVRRLHSGCQPQPACPLVLFPRSSSVFAQDPLVISEIMVEPTASRGMQAALPNYQMADLPFSPRARSAYLHSNPCWLLPSVSSVFRPLSTFLSRARRSRNLTTSQSSKWPLRNGSAHLLHLQLTIRAICTHHPIPAPPTQHPSSTISCKHGPFILCPHLASANHAPFRSDPSLSIDPRLLATMPRVDCASS